MQPKDVKTSKPFLERKKVMTCYHLRVEFEAALLYCWKVPELVLPTSELGSSVQHFQPCSLYLTVSSDGFNDSPCHSAFFRLLIKMKATVH